MANIFYVYQLRVDGEQFPFYIGKGKGDRLLSHLKVGNLSRRNQKNSIIKSAMGNGLSVRAEILEENLSELEAFELEEMFIWLYGRLDKKTGILSNHTDGAGRRIVLSPRPFYGSYPVGEIFL